MTQFNYRARNTKGGLVEGTLEGESTDDIHKKLSEEGLIPISVTGRSAANMEIKLPFLSQKKVGDKEIVLFTKQFHTLFQAGMNIETILGTLAKQQKNVFFRETLETIRKDIQEGSTMALAFGRHTKVFDPLYINMLASGEEAGILEDVLGQLADFVEKDFTMRKNIKGAMMYPKIVITVLILAIILMMTFVLPQFKQFFAKFDADLPLPTRVLMKCSDFMTTYWYIMFGILILMIVAYRRFAATAAGRKILDRLAFKIPIFGPLNIKVCNARFANIVSSLYRGGMPVTKALEITSKTIGNVILMASIKKVQVDVEKGSTIADSMRKHEFFSPIIIEATAIGEKSGSLDGMLKSIAKHFDMEINHTIKNLTALIEPILLGCIFGIVLGFALAIFLPMWGMSKAVLK